MSYSAGGTQRFNSFNIDYKVHSLSPTGWIDKDHAVMTVPRHIHDKLRVLGRSGLSGLGVKALNRNARDVGSNPTCTSFPQLDVKEKKYLLFNTIKTSENYIAGGLPSDIYMATVVVY